MSSLFHTLNISRQDMLTRLADLDVISNNLANVNTAGFKGSRSNFQELLQSATRDGVFTPSTQSLMNQGALRSSQNPLDWAIQGEGFFSLRLPNGQSGYTRDGQFLLDPNRQIVNANGFPLVWQGQIPDNALSVSITRDGTVEALLPNGTKAVAGTVQLTQFTNPTGLIAAGHNVWRESPGSGAPRTGTAGTGTLGQIAGNTVEQSNVSMAREMTQLISDQRAFQLSTKSFQQTDEMIQGAINLRR